MHAGEHDAEIRATAEGSDAGHVSSGGCSRDFDTSHIRQMFLLVFVWSAVIFIQMSAVQHSAASSNKPPSRQMKQVLRRVWLEHHVRMQEKQLEVKGPRVD